MICHHNTTEFQCVNKHKALHHKACKVSPTRHMRILPISPNIPIKGHYNYWNIIQDSKKWKKTFSDAAEDGCTWAFLAAHAPPTPQLGNTVFPRCLLTAQCLLILTGARKIAQFCHYYAKLCPMPWCAYYAKIYASIIHLWLSPSNTRPLCRQLLPSKSPPSHSTTPLFKIPYTSIIIHPPLPKSKPKWLIITGVRYKGTF